MANKTKADLVAELKTLGVEGYDPSATNAALQALIDANTKSEEEETDADDEKSEVEEETTEDEKEDAPAATQEETEETEESDDADEKEEDEEGDIEEDKAAQREAAKHFEPSIAVLTNKKTGKVIKTFTERLDGIEWLNKARSYNAQNRALKIELK